MSGRWVENTLPWSSLLVLDHAISSTSGFEWEQRPSELNDLRELDLELDATQDSLRALIEQAAGLGIDNEALEAALEGDDERLTSISAEATRSSDSITDLSRKISSSISNLSSLVTRRTKLLSRMEKNLPSELKVVTGHHSKSKRGGSTNVKTLERHLGRYRAYEWDDQYSGISADFSWQNNLDGAYHSSRGVLTGTAHAASAELDSYRGSLKKLEGMRRQADEASVRASEEQLKRERDRAIQKMLRERGYTMKRKVVGKKVEFAVVHYEG
jgi:hypothetical protein